MCDVTVVVYYAAIAVRQVHMFSVLLHMVLLGDGKYRRCGTGVLIVRHRCKFVRKFVRSSKFEVRSSISFVVRRSSFVVRRSSFVVRRSSFVVRRSSFIVIRRSLSFVVHCHSSFIVVRRSLSFVVHCLSSSISIRRCHSLSFVVRRCHSLLFVVVIVILCHSLSSLSSLSSSPWFLWIRSCETAVQSSVAETRIQVGKSSKK